MQSIICNDAVKMHVIMHGSMVIVLTVNIHIYILIVVIRVLGKFVSNLCHPKISYKMNLAQPTLT